MKFIDKKIKLWVWILLFSKIAYTIYGVFIFGKISSISDADSYLASAIEISMRTLTNNTVLMSTLTAILKKILFFDFLVHLTYSVVSFYFIKVLIEEMHLSKAQQYFLVFLLVMPSFGTWTSIIVKEAVSCSFSCVVLIWIINLFRNEKFRYALLINITCLYFVLVLRPIVGFGLICLIITIYVYRIQIINKYLKFFIVFATIFFLTFSVVSLTLSYIKNEFIPTAEYYFDPRFSNGKSARPLGFWKTTADFYLKAPEGIFIANLGPTLFESIANPFFIPYFMEGIFFILVCAWMFMGIIFYQIKRGIINPYFLLTFFFGILLILLLNYPFGLFNAGSALRYRSSYYHIIIVLLFFFYTQRNKDNFSSTL